MSQNIVKVKQPDPPVAKEILAEAIVRIGNEVTKLNNSGLNQRAIIILLQDYTGLARRDIKTILDAIPRLRGWYCR